MTLDLAAIEARWADELQQPEGDEESFQVIDDLRALLAAVRTLEAEKEELRRSATEQVRGLEAEVRRLRDNCQLAESRVTALEEALRDVMAAQSGNPKSCGHEFTCICPYDRAAALLTKEGGL